MVPWGIQEKTALTKPDIWKVESKRRRGRPAMTGLQDLTSSVRQAVVAAPRTMTFQYGRPLERHS